MIKSAASTRVFLNPHAGTALEESALREMIAGILPGAELIVPAEGEDLGRLAGEAAAAGCKTIVAAGGDGTVNGILNGIAPYLSSVRLGVLPLGTGNDFVRSIHIPTDPEHALAVLREGCTRQIDLIRATTPSISRLFLNVSAGGFSSKVSEVASDVKETWGPLCYARSFVGALPDLNDYQTQIILDEVEEFTTPAYNVIVANARFVAGGVPIAPEAKLDDGLADLLILPVASFRELASLGPATLLGRHLDDDRLVFRRARKISVNSQPPMRFNVDGELLPAERISFEVLPGALQVIVGPQPRQE
jgi:diacylglycerol kinase (ATP)